MPEDPTVPPAVHLRATRVATPRPMRRGSLTERYVRCHKPNCPCAEREAARHGPYYSVSRVVKGRTQSRWLTAAQASLARAQVAAGQEFREQLEAYWQACEQWADTQLDAARAASDAEAAQKGGSKRRSPRKSRRRSRHS